LTDRCKKLGQPHNNAEISIETDCSFGICTDDECLSLLPIRLVDPKDYMMPAGPKSMNIDILGKIYSFDLSDKRRIRGFPKIIKEILKNGAKAEH